MTLTQLLLINAGAIAVLLFAVWLISLPLRDVSIVDIAWGLGFVLVAWLSFIVTGPSTPRKLLLVACTTIWGTRLSGYLAWRNWGKAEDRRYQAMRFRFGPRFSLYSLVIVFALQGAVMWTVSLPVQVGQIMHNSGEIGLIGVMGVITWIVGLCFETVGDYQLAAFKRDPANTGRVMDRGLWRYTRHPNYFGDFLVWWGLYFISLGDGRTWWSIIGPLVMSIFLMRISGVTLLEKSLLNRKPGYEAYVKRTSPFFPLPPKHDS